MGLSADSAKKNSDLGIFGDFWGDGADSAQKVDTLAGRRVSSTPGKRLAEAWRASHSASLGEVMTHPYSCMDMTMLAYIIIHCTIVYMYMYSVTCTCVI
jgi:hypothetical protein